MEPQHILRLKDKAESNPTPPQVTPVESTTPVATLPGGAPDRPSKKLKTIPLIIAVSCLVLFIVAAAMLVNRNNRDEITLKNFKNSVIGVELKIPQSWYMDLQGNDTEGTSVYVNFKPNSKNQKIISVSCLPGTRPHTKEDMFKIVETGVIPSKQKDSFTVSDRKKTQIGEYPTYRFTAKRGDISSYHAYYLVDSRDVCSLFVTDTVKNNDSTVTPLEAKADEIIDSFRSLKK